MPATHHIDSPEALSAALATICSLNLLTPVLFVGLHGIRICRNGRLCLLQLYVPPLDAVFLIDISTLDQLAFTTAAPGTRRGPTLKYLFECPDVPKVFYDGNIRFISVYSAAIDTYSITRVVRNDADNLFNVYDISLQGVVDLQLYELVCTWFNIYPSFK